jgi:hypothetical protein
MSTDQPHCSQRSTIESTAQDHNSINIVVFVSQDVQRLECGWAWHAGALNKQLPTERIAITSSPTDGSRMANLFNDELKMA